MNEETLPGSKIILQKLESASPAVWQFLYLYKLMLETCGKGWPSEQVHRGGSSQFSGIFHGVFGQDCPVRELEDIGILREHGEKEDKVRIVYYEFLPDPLMKQILDELKLDKWDPTPIAIQVLKNQIDERKLPQISTLVRDHNLLPNIAKHYLEILSKDPVCLMFPLTIEVMEAEAQRIIKTLASPNLYDLLTRLNINLLVAISIGKYMREQNYITNFPNLPQPKEHLLGTTKEGNEIVENSLGLWKNNKISISNSLMEHILLHPSSVIDIMEGLFNKDPRYIELLKSGFEVQSKQEDYGYGTKLAATSYQHTQTLPNNREIDIQPRAPPVVITRCPACGKMVQFDQMTWKCPECGARWSLK